MDRRAKAWLVGVFGGLGSIALLALTVYPFNYGLVESTLLVGGLLVFMCSKQSLAIPRFDRRRHLALAGGSSRSNCQAASATTPTDSATVSVGTTTPGS